MSSDTPPDPPASATVQIDVYSDVVCPWCYIGHRRLATALEALPDGVSAAVTFRPFQLDPGAPDSPEPVKRRLARKFGPQAEAVLTRVTQQAASEGLEMNWDLALSVNTRTAHRLLEHVRQQYGNERQLEVLEQLFAMYFTNGGNVADNDQLADAAARAGLDRHAIREFLASELGGPELEESFEAARRLGVQAVPTFVIDGRYAVQGAQPAATLVETISEVARLKRAS